MQEYEYLVHPLRVARVERGWTQEDTQRTGIAGAWLDARQRSPNSRITTCSEPISILAKGRNTRAIVAQNTHTCAIYSHAGH